MPIPRHAIVFVTPFDADTSLVNRLTGRHGYGHVALWSGIYDPHGQPLVLDASIALEQVAFRPLDAMALGAPYELFALDDMLGEWMFNRAVRCVGRPYDYHGLVRSRVTDAAFTCSGLICCALPVQLERRCRPRGRPVSPNDLARGLGVRRWS